MAPKTKKSCHQSIQVRMHKDIKAKAEKIFASVGLDSPTAIRMFFVKVVNIGGIPFELSPEEDHYSEEQLAYIDRLAEEAKKPGNSFGPFDSVEEMLQHMKQQKI